MHEAGSGFMAFWTNVDATIEDEYVAFLSREHMPERLRLPGFRRVRLLRSALAGADAPSFPFFALYETETLAVLTSPAYLERLNNPTPWTRDFMPKLHGSVRGAGESIASAGAGAGGFVAVLRASSGPGRMPDKARLGEAADLPFVTGVRILKVDPASTAVRSPGTARNGNPTKFSTLVLGEATRAEAAEAAIRAVEDMMPELGRTASEPFRHVYRLAFSLDRRDIGLEREQPAG